MNSAIRPQVGTIVWQDLTVGPAEEIRDFYQEVIGWEARDHDMGDYNDFDIISPTTGAVVTGICHARDTNANVPPAWLIYFAVEDVEASARRCVELGGAILDGPRDMGGGSFCVIRDPAGAVCALYRPPAALE
jgi:predicted enzyme related to lactoylglutathione lyase